MPLNNTPILCFKIRGVGMTPVLLNLQQNLQLLLISYVASCKDCLIFWLDGSTGAGQVKFWWYMCSYV
jgi:hypothetical protein